MWEIKQRDGHTFIASNCISACLYLYCIVRRGWRLRCKSLFAANNIAFLRASSILERAAEREMDGALNFNQEEAWSDGDLLWSVYFFCVGYRLINHTHTYTYSSCDHDWHYDDNPSLSHQLCWRPTPPHIPKSHHTRGAKDRWGKTEWENNLVYEDLKPKGLSNWLNTAVLVHPFP